MQNIVRTFDRTPVDLIKAVFASTSFANFLQALDGDLEITTDDLLDDAVIRKAFSADGFSAGCGVLEGPLETLSYELSSRQARVRTNEAAVPALDRLLAVFKRELLED